MMRLLILLAGFALPALAYAQGIDFIPLLPSLPGITEVSKANSLAPLLSQIYKICIGLAAVLAVLQIMRAGIEYMGGDSVTEKSHAKALIGTSLAGLLLVLSPVIVFSIINPDILNLDIGAKNLQTTAGDGVSDFVSGSQTSVPATTVEECIAKGGSASGNPPNIVCSVASNSPAASGAYGTCKDYTSPEVVPASSSCKPPGEESAYIQISDSCCSALGIQKGYKCCGLNVRDTVPVPPDATKPIIVTKYFYVPLTGATKDYGPLTTTDRDTYLKFSTSCMQANGLVKERLDVGFGKGTACTPEQMKEVNDVPTSFRPYINCVPATVSCKL